LVDDIIGYINLFLFGKSGFSTYSDLIFYFFPKYRDDEYLKFVPHSKAYHVVPGAEFQCKLGNHNSRKLSTIDEQDDDVANRRGIFHQVSFQWLFKIIYLNIE